MINTTLSEQVKIPIEKNRSKRQNRYPWRTYTWPLTFRHCYRSFNKN